MNDAFKASVVTSVSTASSLGLVRTGVDSRSNGKATARQRASDINRKAAALLRNYENRLGVRVGDIRSKALSEQDLDLLLQVDGILGPRTRQAMGDYQKSEDRPVTGRLDAETSRKLVVGPESVGGNFKGAGHEVSEGAKEAGHDVSNGKPVTAGKELAKGVGRAGKKPGKRVKGAVTP